MSNFLLKNVFSEEFFGDFIYRFSKVYPINGDEFLSLIFSRKWESLELKERMKHTAQVLNLCLKIPYEQQIEKLCDFVTQNPDLQNSNWLLAYMFIPEFIDMYGRDYYSISMNAMECITNFTSCEFAIRSFILANPEKSMAQMYKWSEHAKPNVRRFASEGCRPRLPWAQKLPFLINDPSPIMPILENIKFDTSDFVMKSFANNLNDISKDHPQVVLKFAKENIGKNKKTDKALKHALRTLLKRGDGDAMCLFGFSKQAHVILNSFTLTMLHVTGNMPLKFECAIINNEPVSQIIRLEYALYFLRQNGTYSKKVFFLSEKEYNSKQTILVSKEYSFVPRTTRKYYPGTQYVSIIINGNESEKQAFNYS